MSALVAVLALLIAAAVAACCVVLLRRVRSLEASLVGLEIPDIAPLPVQEQRAFITVEVLNPIELASTQSRAAALLGSVRPQLVTKIVYDQVAKRMLEGLEEEGVVAEVQVHVAE